MYSGTLVFATNNENKVKEVNLLLPEFVSVLSLVEINCTDEIQETHDTIEDNALEKAQYIFDKYKINCFAEDTGLEAEALNGAPGVYSARYAGEGRRDADNIALLLKNLMHKKNRSARFKTIISLIIDSQVYTFEGIVDGEIVSTPIGKLGFGYDSIFKPLGFENTFAQMTMEEKSKISHRGRAIEKLVKFLSAF